MSAPRDPDLIIANWVEDGPHRLPESTRRSIEVSTRTLRQSRRPMWMPWRFPDMNGNTRLAPGAVAVLAGAVGGLVLIRPSAGDPGSGVGSSTASPTQSPSPTAPSAPAPTESLVDTSDWVEYVSDQYGFTIGHPGDWRVHQ